MPSFVIKEAKSFPNRHGKQETQNVVKDQQTQVGIWRIGRSTETMVVLLEYSSFAKRVHIKACKAESGGFL
jgi:hypothetical protein